MSPFEYLLLTLPLLILSLTVHEFGHAWVALKQGDDTAYRLGRVTLNPAAHIDPIGTLLMPIMAALTGAPLLGWAKPVPVTTRKFRDFRRGDLLTSAAGIAGNLILVLVFAVVGEALAFALRSGFEIGRSLQIALQMCRLGGELNVALALFNLLPIPPLDGSRIVVHYLSARAAEAYREFSRYGMMILWGLVIFGALGFIWPLAQGANDAVVAVVDLPFGLL
ncbi:MAG: peptidase [Gemmatimonadetes bacterium]|nr:peptidase [Gemmatimonadota bacterium]